MKYIAPLIYVIFAISAIQCSKNSNIGEEDTKVCFVAENNITNKAPAQDEILSICPVGMIACNEICCLSDWRCEVIDGVSRCLSLEDDFDMPRGPHGYISIFEPR